MNRQEYLNNNNKRNSYYKQVQKLLKDWKVENNISGRCAVHHRDDTEETRTYNDKHYELWGFEIDENGNTKFELGKYVQFLTATEHSVHHNAGKHHTDEAKAKMSASRRGDKNHMFGKHHSEETKAKISAANAGAKRSDETRKRMSESRRGENNPRFGKGYVIAGERNGMFGKHHSEEACECVREAALKDGYIYKLYKNNGGTLSWQAFRHALKIGLIDKEMYNVRISSED